MVRIFFRRAKFLFQIGILGILEQHDQIRPQNAPKQAKMDKNRQSRSKTYFSDDAVPPRSHAAMHTFYRHVRTFPGYFVVVFSISSIFSAHFKAFLGHFWPFWSFWYALFWPLLAILTHFPIEKRDFFGQKNNLTT